MATIADTSTSVANNVTNHTVLLPSNIVSGDLLVVAFSANGSTKDPVVTFPNEGTDWIVLFNNATPWGLESIRLKVCYRNANGTEGASITVTTDDASYSAHGAYRITEHNDQSPPEGSVGVPGGPSSFPDPDSLSPNGQTQTYLWLAIHGHSNVWNTTAYPSGYTLGQIARKSTGGQSGACIAMAGRVFRAASEDPGSFTVQFAPRWVAGTLAVYPYPIQTEIIASILSIDRTVEEALSIDRTLATALSLDRTITRVLEI